MASVKDRVLQLVAEQPMLSNDRIAEMVRKEFRGANTTAASVSSIKSVARKSGQLEGAVINTIGSELEEEDEPIPEGDEAVTEEEIDLRIRKRFDALDRMANGVMRFVVPALIVSGPPGLGKSFGVKRAIELRERQVEDEGRPNASGSYSNVKGHCPRCRADVEEVDNRAWCETCQTFVKAILITSGHGEDDGSFRHDYISGSISGPGLYISLWNMKDGGLVVLDDCDAVFGDEDTLNILKAVLDSHDKRVISWRKQARWLKDLGIDESFEFKGSVIFLTNIDFERKIDTNKPGAVHFKALMDRCLYLHLTIRTMKDFMVRIKQVVYGEKMLEKYGLEPDAIEEIMNFVWNNKRRFYGMSLRLIHQIALCRTADSENWKADVEMTKMRAFTEDLEENLPKKEVATA